MTKKDFEILAKNIRQMLDPNMRLNAAIAVASACMEINPRFKPETFYKACGVSA